MTCGLCRATISTACLLIWPAVTLAQSAIAGRVSDFSGGVLPGVTVHTASAALIEKARTVVTDQSLDTIPVGQNIWEMAELVPSINLDNASGQNAGTVGGQGGATQTYMSVRGMTASQNVVMVDGMNVSGLEATGAVQA